MSDDESSIDYEYVPLQDEGDIMPALKSLFSFVFTLNCHLDDSSITSEEKNTLNELQNVEIFENFKDLVLNLVKFKKKFKNSEMAELVNRSDQFESMIQKLEAKVRSHIGIEQQLKLHIETSQNQCEELEKMNNSLKKGSNSESNEKQENEMKLLKEKLLEIEKDAKKKESEFLRITNENMRLKKIIEDKSKQIYLLRKENKPRVNCAESNDYIKKQIEEQNSEIIKIQQKLRKDVYVWSPKKKHQQKSIKRNISPMDASEYISPAFKIAQNYIRGHIRSFSEH